MYTSGSVTSKLINGSVWYRTLEWLLETGNKTKEEIITDSTSWGNYYNDTFSNSGYVIETGKFNNTKANNIFDLAGNVLEWSTASNNTTERFYLGGSVHFDGDQYPVSSMIYNSTTYKNRVVGFRTVLYLNN